MSLIIEPILQGKFELIRSQIGFILATELASQRQINANLLNAQLILPVGEQNQNLIKQYSLNLECIPDRVYEERTVRFSCEEVKMVNVVNLGITDMPNTTNSSQVCNGEFMVEVFHTGISNETNDGDYLSGIKRDRLINICWKILRDRNYLTLGINDGTIGHSVVSKVNIANIQEGANDADSISYASFTLSVKFVESVFEYTGSSIFESATVVQINELEKGYAWLFIEDNPEGFI